MTEEFRQQWLEAMQEYSKALEVEDDSVEIITNPSDVDSSVSMPAVKLDADGRVEKYVQIRYATLAAAIANAQTLLGQIDTDATTLRTTVQTLQEEARQAQEIIDDLDGAGEQVEQLGRAIEQANGLIQQMNEALQTAANDHSTAQSDHEQAASDHTTATNDHTKVQGAGNVNAELNGITVTITNRSGQSKSVDIGFDIYKTYTSVAAMNADASNVPLGKFVMIATTDKTSEENARMYIKSSQGNFRFLCDLDQASAEAWADWLNNHKSAIEQAVADALNAASNANTAANNADSKAKLAETAAAGAEKVNAILSGTTLIVTNRNGQQTSVDTKGEKGDQGVQGLKGDKGDKGDQGIQGVKGDQGIQGLKGDKGDKGEKGDKGDQGDNIDYSTMTEQEKEDLSQRVVQKVTADNVFGPTYDSERECVVFPITMAVRYDAARQCVVFG